MIYALLVLGGLSLFANLIAIVVMLFLLIQIVRDQRDTLTLTKLVISKVASTERLAVSIHTMLITELAGAGAMPMPNPAGPPGPSGPPWNSMGITQRGGKFITEDGRHEANTLEELIHKLQDDPRYRVANEADVEKLREAFEEHTEPDDIDEMGDDDEEELDGDEWKRNTDGS